MKYFDINELIRCYRAQNRCKGCPLKSCQELRATVTPEIESNAKALTDMVLDPARGRLGKAITVTSCFRCLHHNREIGSADNSQHVKAMAADLVCGSAADNLQLARMIVAGGNWDQMILEDVKPGSLEPRWVHVSWKRNGANRREVRKKVVGRIGYPMLSPSELAQLKRLKVNG